MSWSKIEEFEFGAEIEAEAMLQVVLLGVEEAAANSLVLPTLLIGPPVENTTFTDIASESDERIIVSFLPRGLAWSGVGVGVGVGTAPAPSRSRGTGISAISLSLPVPVSPAA